MTEIDTITISELDAMALRMYDHLVKAVVDVEEGILVVDAELHADQEAYLLERGSSQANLWGINLYPKEYGSDYFIEYDSMINIRPRQKNMSRNVEDETVRAKIIEIVHSKVTP